MTLKNGSRALMVWVKETATAFNDTFVNTLPKTWIPANGLIDFKVLDSSLGRWWIRKSHIVNARMLPTMKCKVVQVTGYGNTFNSCLLKLRHHKYVCEKQSLYSISYSKSTTRTCWSKCWPGTRKQTRDQAWHFQPCLRPLLWLHLQYECIIGSVSSLIDRIEWRSPDSMPLKTPTLDKTPTCCEYAGCGTYNAALFTDSFDYWYIFMYFFITYIIFPKAMAHIGVPQTDPADRRTRSRTAC